MFPTDFGTGALSYSDPQDYINFFQLFYTLIITTGVILRIVKILSKAISEGNDIKAATEKAKKVLMAGVLAVAVPGLLNIIISAFA